MTSITSFCGRLLVSKVQIGKSNHTGHPPDINFYVLSCTLLPVRSCHLIRNVKRLSNRKAKTIFFCEHSFSCWRSNSSNVHVQAVRLGAAYQQVGHTVQLSRLQSPAHIVCCLPRSPTPHHQDPLSLRDAPGCHLTRLPGRAHQCPSEDHDGPRTQQCQ